MANGNEQSSSDVKKHEQSEPWGVLLRRGVICFVRFAFLTVISFIALLIPISYGNSLEGCSLFVSTSYVILIIGLILIWAYPMSSKEKEKMDLDEMLRIRVKGTLGILVLIALLGIASMIADVSKVP